MAAAYISVFLLSGFRLYLAMGLGATTGMSAEVQMALMGTGSILGLSICILTGNQLKQWWLQRRNQKIRQKSGRKAPYALRFLHRYGLWGLAGGTLFLGTIPSVAIALIAGYSPRNTFLYLVGGKLAWILYYLFISDPVFVF